MILRTVRQTSMRLALLGITLWSLGGWAQVHVVKRFAEGNPTLSVAGFQGADAARARLETVLRRCGWFQVVAAGQPAQYRITGVYAQSGPVHRVQLSVAAEGSAVVSRASQAPELDLALFDGVDQVIEGLFRNPGPCSGKIAFAVAGSGQRKEVYTCNFDGTEARRLTHNATISTEPSWGPDGTTLVYTLYGNNATSVVLVDTLRNRQRRISNLPGLNAGAALSPDGRWVALSLSVDRRIELYLLELATGRRSRVTNDFASESSPCWSPKGGTLCYVTDKAGNPQLFLVSARGGESVRLIPQYEEAVSPDWSPVSNRICFSTRLGGQYVLAVVDMSGQEREREIVVQAPGDWEAPSWAPDGRHVVCSRRTGRSRSLYVVDTWQGRFHAITQGGDHSLPSWGPVP